MRNLILFVGMLCLLAGCAGEGGGSTVTGKVTLDDGSAAPRGSVTLRNADGSFHGAIQDGTYTVENVPDGDYEVAVAGVTDQEPGDGDGDESMVYDEETGGTVETEAPKSLIDVKYSNPSASGLTVTVPGGSYDLTLDRDGGAPAGDGS